MSFFDFTDPTQNGPLLGMLQGLGQAAMPSRLPVPFGAVLGQAAGGYAQGQQQNLANRKSQLELSTGNLGLAQALTQLDAQMRLGGHPNGIQDVARQYGIQLPMPTQSGQQSAPQAPAAPSVSSPFGTRMDALKAAGGGDINAGAANLGTGQADQNPLLQATGDSGTPGFVAAKGRVAGGLPPNVPQQVWDAMSSDSRSKLLEEWAKPADLRENEARYAYNSTTPLFKNTNASHELTDSDRQRIGLRPGDKGTVDANGKVTILQHDPSWSADEAQKVADARYPTELALRQQGQLKTPEVLQQELQQKVREQQALMPGQIDLEKAKAAATFDPDAAKTLGKMVANYDAPLPAGFALKSPFGQAVIEAAKTENPDYDAKEYNSRNAAKLTFSRQNANTIRSLQVGVQHLDLLSQAVQQLKNGPTPLFNSISNEWQRQTGSPLPTNVDVIKNIVGAEITKAIQGGAGGVTDREENRKSLQTASSPDQMAGAINSYKGLMAGQLGGLRKQYESTTGAKDFDRFLTAESQAAIGGGAGQQGANAPPKTYPQPSQAAIGRLKMMKDTAKFDEMFGPGAAAKVLGTGNGR